jgi:hypothetical protein
VENGTLWKGSSYRSAHWERNISMDADHAGSPTGRIHSICEVLRLKRGGHAPLHPLHESIQLLKVFIGLEAGNIEVGLLPELRFKTRLVFMENTRSAVVIFGLPD